MQKFYLTHEPQVFTQDIKRAHRVAADIEAGMVWINSSNDSDFR